MVTNALPVGGPGCVRDIFVRGRRPRVRTGMLLYYERCVRYVHFPKK